MKMKKRYRFLSVLLVCSLVLSGLFTGWVAKAETTSSISMKEDFEDDTTGSVDYGSAAFSLYHPEVSGYDENNVHGGNKSLQMVAANEMKTYFSDEHIQLESGRTYQISFWYKATANTVGDVNYKEECLFFVSMSNGKQDKNIEYLKDTNGEWKQYTGDITVPGDLEMLKFATYGLPTGAFTIYLDDIEVKEQFTVSVKSAGNGTATVDGVSSLTSYADETVTYEATADKGYSFVGWKDESGTLISSEMTYEYKVAADCSLTAYFTRSIFQVEDFEDDTSNSSYGSSAFTLYDSTVSGNDDANVHGGSKSLQMVAAGDWKTYFSDEHIQLASGTIYQISFWYKATANTVGDVDYKEKDLFYFKMSNETQASKYFKDTNGEWVQYTEVITVTNDSVVPGFHTYNHPKEAFTIYLDDIEVKEQFTVSANSDGNGSATVNGQVSGTSYVNDTITYQATPNAGYAFKCWTDAEGNTVSTNATYEFTVKNGMMLKAHFEKILCGDVNNDKEIDIVDLVRLNNYIEDTSLEINTDLADCYMDEKIDEVDWTTLREALLNLTELPCSEPEVMSLDSLLDEGAVNNNDYFTRDTEVKYSNSTASLHCNGDKVAKEYETYTFNKLAKKYTDYEVSAYCYNIKSSVQNIQMYSTSCCAYLDASSAGNGKWDEIKMIVNTGDSETLSFQILVYPGQEFYISGLTATEQVYSGSYSEDFYNLLDGNKQFDSSEAEVKEFTVKTNKAGRYRLGYTANVPEGTQAKVGIISNGNEVYRASIATEGAWERFQTEVILDADAETVIRIETLDGTTMFEEMYFFQSKYAYVYNPNDYIDYTCKAAPSRSATYAADSAVKLSVAGEAITNDFAGFGGMYYAYNYIPDSKNRTYTTEMQALEVARLAASGTTVVRTQFSPAWAWDEEKCDWNWDSEEMQGFYQYMADMKANGIDVALNTDWSLSNVRASKITGGYENPFYALGNGTESDCDKAFVEWVKTAVTTIRGKGYDNLKYLFMFTEPVRTTDKATYDSQFALWKTYVVAVDKALEEAGVRNDVKMVGFNTGKYDSTVANQNGISDWYPLEKMAQDQEILAAIDIFTHHAYESSDKEADNYKTWYDYMSKCVEIANSVGKPFWFDEGEWEEKDPDSWTEGLSSGYHGLQLGVKMLAAMNSGLQGMIRWTLVDQYWMNDTGTKKDYEWTQGCHIWGVLPNMYTSTIPRNAYYAYSLFAKYTNGENVQVYAGTNADGVYITSVKNGEDTTVFVVNMNNSAKEIEVTLANALQSQNLNRHTYSAISNRPTTAAHIADSDLTLKSVTNKFNDKISAHSIYVYTTQK